MHSMYTRGTLSSVSKMLHENIPGDERMRTRAERSWSQSDQECSGNMPEKCAVHVTYRAIVPDVPREARVLILRR